MKKTIICLILLALAACKKDGPAPHPLAGDWKIKGAGSGAYLRFSPKESNGYNWPIFDVAMGGDLEIRLVPGLAAGQYYVTAKNYGQYCLDTSVPGGTFIIAGTFLKDSEKQLFTLEPIYEGADRYYIRSVGDPSKYVWCCPSCWGRSSTTGYLQLTDYSDYDYIWTLEKI